jgi:hypothetical protein
MHTTHGCCLARVALPKRLDKAGNGLMPSDAWMTGLIHFLRLMTKSYLASNATGMLVTRNISALQVRLQ